VRAGLFEDLASSLEQFVRRPLPPIPALDLASDEQCARQFKPQLQPLGTLKRGARGLGGGGQVASGGQQQRTAAFYLRQRPASLQPLCRLLEHGGQSFRPVELA
jgi:hypothetical protein